MQYCLVYGPNSCAEWFISSSKKVVRIITGSKYLSHTSPLFKSLNILPLPRLNDLQAACFVFSCRMNLLPATFCSMFESNSVIHSHDTRHKSDLKHIYHRLTLRSTTIRIHGVALWNSLPIELKNCSTLKQFKSLYKQSLMTNLWSTCIFIQCTY